MYDEAKWNEALVERGRHAEEKFAKREKVNDEDMAVVALLHPDRFEISIKMKD